MPEDSLAKHLTDRYEALKGLRSGWETLWTEIARYVIPRRMPGLNGSIQSPGTGNETLLFDSTAVRANMTLANGQMAWMSPLEAPWFAFEPQQGQGEDAKRWLSQATTAAREELAVSNFYTAIHEFYLDRGAFGTACLYVEPGRRNNLSAQTWPVGTFVVDVDENGLVDTVMREFELTARQAVQKFTEEKVSKIIRDKAKEGGAKALEKSKFLHAIYPREDKDRDAKKQDDRNMPIASVYLEKEGCHLCKESGFAEMPVMVSRYLEWGSGIGSLYGWSPAFSALPEARQVNFGAKMLDAAAEKEAFPPMLVPDDFEGELDANANAVNYFSAAIAQTLPRRLHELPIRLDFMLQRVEERQKAINDAFHVDLFQMFAQLQKQMTAREVSERAQEKLIQFSPTFSRLTSELFNPLLERVFGIMLRLGKFGPVDLIPQNMVQMVGDGMAYIAPPRVQYSSRIALALRALPTLGYQRTLERIAAVATLQPSVLDIIDFDAAERATAMTDGVPVEFIKSEKEVKDLRAARAQQQAAAQQQAQMLTMADAVSKVGKVPADSPVGNVIASQLGQAA